MQILLADMIRVLTCQYTPARRRDGQSPTARKAGRV